jgi:hypothetical protein
LGSWWNKNTEIDLVDLNESTDEFKKLAKKNQIILIKKDQILPA